MTRSQLERLWIVGAVLVAILLAFVGYTVFIHPQNSSTSSAQSQVDAARTDNLLLQTRVSLLRTQSTHLAQYESDLKNAQLALPSTAGLADFLRAVQGIGDKTATVVSTISAGVPTNVTAAASPTASATTAAGNGSAAASGATATLNGTPVYALPITASVTGSAGALNQFLAQLQNVQPRAVLISQLVESTGLVAGKASSSTLTLQLTMQAYVAPAGAPEQARLAAAAGN
jgi:Tfp pilus assembly protein PilO